MHRCFRGKANIADITVAVAPRAAGNIPLSDLRIKLQLFTVEM